MSRDWVSELDLQLAWQRVKLDRPDRAFVTHPHLLSWIEADLKTWLDNLAAQLRAGYRPHDCLTCYAPKGSWMVRPGAVLDIGDEVVFNAILGRFHNQIWDAIGWSQGAPDIAYQFQRQPSRPEWIRAGFPVQKQWREKSLKNLTRAVQFVLFADIAAFYENIEFSRLSSDLRSIGIGHSLLNDVFMPCLHRWAQPRGKGIPQGYSGSDILGKLYLDPVDQGLRNAGFKHLRYVDDIRIFCRTSLEAKRALLFLNNLLRNRGLNPQTAKTEILQLADARRKIDGVSPTIEAIQTQLSEEMEDVWSLDDAYGTLAEIEEVIEKDPNAPPLEVLERTFHEYFSPGGAVKFDKTLFHYVLSRLGKTKSRIAVTYCLELLPNRPEETEYVLRYFNGVDLTDQERGSILHYSASSDAIYDYQLYQIVRWFVARQNFPDELVDLCRGWALDKNRDPWLRTYSLSVLGAKGNPSDLEELENAFKSASTEGDKAEIVSALVKMEVSRRNAFYNRVKNDGELVRLAVEASRSGVPNPPLWNRRLCDRKACAPAPRLESDIVR